MFMFVGGVALATLAYFVLVPQYLEFRRIVGIDHLLAGKTRFLCRLMLHLWGLKTQVSGALSIFVLGLPDLLERLHAFDFGLLLEPSQARWISGALGLASLVFASYGHVTAAKAEPIRSRD